jgi:hypothetical protein
MKRGWRAYAELDGDGEIVTACFFGNGIASFNAGEIDEGGLDDAAFALGGFQQAFGESELSVLRSLRLGDWCYRKPA